MPSITIGVDTGKTQHQAAAADPEHGRVLGQLRFRVDRHTALVLLGAYPTAAAIAAACPDALTDLLHRASRGDFHRERAPLLQAAARTSIAVRSCEPALGMKVHSLVRQVNALTQEITSLDETIATEFQALGYRVEAFPAGGTLSLATILAETGDVQRFATAKQFLAHFGWCPTDHQSGTFKHPHPRLSRAGNRYVRRIVWMLAIHVTSQPGPLRDYFQQRTA